MPQVDESDIEVTILPTDKFTTDTSLEGALNLSEVRINAHEVLARHRGRHGHRDTSVKGNRNSIKLKTKKKNSPYI